MRYLLAIHLTDEGLAKVDGEWSARLEEVHTAIQKELHDAGEFVEAHELPETNAKTVRRTGDELVVTDGPFTESKEWIAGYYVVDVASRERAIEIAGKFIEAELSPIEVREVR
jgi:hypothetical protein